MNLNIFRVFSERSFLYLWVGEVFIQVASNIFNFFLIFTVFKLTNSSTAVSGVVLSFTVPAILFGSIAGVYVDRWSKKKVLVITNTIRALLLIFLAFNLNNLFMIYFVSVLFSTLFQFFIPAEAPIIPTIVKKELLLHANALFGLAIFGSMLVGYMLTGPLLILLEPYVIVLLLGFVLLAGSLFTSFITPHYGKRTVTEKVAFKQIDVLKDIKETLSYVRQRKTVLHSLFLLSLSQILILILATVAPGYASQILGIPIEQFPIMFITPAAIGMVVGLVVLVNVFHSHPKENLITAGIIISGVAMLMLPFCSEAALRGVVVVIAFLLGMANSFVFVPANTRLQEHTSEEVRGKTYGFLNTFIGCISLLPVLLAGGLSDLVGVGAVIIGIGICLILLGVVNMFMD